MIDIFIIRNKKFKFAHNSIKMEVMVMNNLKIASKMSSYEVMKGYVFCTHFVKLHVESNIWEV